MTLQVRWGGGWGGCLAAEAANPAEGGNLVAEAAEGGNLTAEPAEGGEFVRRNRRRRGIWWQNPPKAGVLRILVTDPARKQRESAGIWWQPSYNYAQPNNNNVIFGMCSHFGAGISLSCA